jgi:ABC-type phosphate/phosphonate transport system permease subunit
LPSRDRAFGRPAPECGCLVSTGAASYTFASTPDGLALDEQFDRMLTQILIVLVLVVVVDNVSAFLRKRVT